MSQFVKIVLTVLGIIALYLILANGNAFNNALKTVTTATNTGIAVLQGRTASAAE
jgi:hypothetical protein